MNGKFIDTNIVIYSLSDNEQKQYKALALLADYPVVSVQVLSEAANVMRRKLDFDIPSIRTVINRISQECRSIESISLTTLNGALAIAERYNFSHYDSLIVAAALQADCTILYSEDMQHGQLIEGRMTIMNPFL
jgi:predicted nucleic acid-binding protein